jgi:hypothetical protein
MNEGSLERNPGNWTNKKDESECVVPNTRFAVQKSSCGAPDMENDFIKCYFGAAD